MNAVLPSQLAETQPAASPRHRGVAAVGLPKLRLAGVHLGSWFAASVIATAGCWLTTLASPASASLAAVSALPGLVLVLVGLLLMGPKAPFTWATIQIGTSTGRLLIGLVTALLVYIGLRDGAISVSGMLADLTGASVADEVVPSKFAFFGVFLFTAASTLVADALVFRSFLTSASSSARAGVAGATEPAGDAESSGRMESA